jgi:L-seryl-tRNA(Ser) seleniumtransferase
VTSRRDPDADPRRALPAVERVLASAAFAPLLERAPRSTVATLLRELQHELRAELVAGSAGDQVSDPGWLAARVAAELDALHAPALVRVINATGVILHTNLGRAPLADAAIAAMQEAAAGYTNLEYDLPAGARGSRYVHCVALLRRLTGAGDALVVNNNAGALVLALNTFANGREAIISRGELVEIGGSFRIPDIMARSGARLVEVGSTNRTHLGDYRAALTPETGVLLKVHRSNFRMSGYTSDVPGTQLAAVAREAGAPLVHDLGSGLLLSSASLGLPAEPTVAEALEDGADVVTWSGDKLLGGPQAGILVGAAPLIRACRANPLCRALRVDKLTLSALAATLELYLDPDRACAEIPVLRMLVASAASLRARAERIAAALRAHGIAADVVAGESAVGGGACPDHALPSSHVAIRPVHGSTAALEARLREHRPAVLVRVQDDALRVDPRTVAEGEEAALLDALRATAGA